MQAAEYVRRRDGGWYVGDSGVSVFSVISLWQQGFSPEEIQASYSPLSLQDVYGTILYYMENRDQLGAYFREQIELFHRKKAESEARKPEFYAEMRERVARFRETDQRS
jgi:uncharacterized protein (DUF433 family)